MDFLLLGEIRYEQKFQWYESDEMPSTLGHLNIGGLEEPKKSFLPLTFIPSGLVIIIVLSYAP